LSEIFSNGDILGRIYADDLSPPRLGVDIGLGFLQCRSMVAFIHDIVPFKNPDGDMAEDLHGHPFIDAAFGVARCR
jgi:hypothetical protein